ncbi:MAG: VTT domain-containing protein, partial [Pyrinomonadaceae bacterium]
MFETWQIFNIENIAQVSLIVVFFSIFFATFVSEDAACLTAGALAGQGKISFSLALSACIAGIFVGDILLYWIGRIFGQRIIETRIFERFVSKQAVAKASAGLDNRGASAVFISRFVTGLRLPTYLAAGFLKTNFTKFTFYFLIAALIWTPILVGSAAYASENFFSGGLVLGIVSLFILFRLILHFSSWKNRRMFVGRIKRILNWEFWPIRIFYFPVVIYVLLLAIKHRSLTVFTCSNPGIVAGGFVGESKNEIYNALRQSPDIRNYLLPHLLLEEGVGGSNIQKAKNFISETSISYPVVLKPDQGERGKGVRIITNGYDLETELASVKGDQILQEFFDGAEASVFYYRFPHEREGTIFSITEKCFPKLTGDGRSDLETLILKDPRAVCLAKRYFEQNRERLYEVPLFGEKVQVINIGTHSMGAIFMDGSGLETTALFETIDKIACGFDGFYFGRFDLRAPSFDDFRQGQNIKVVELNGVTSES